LWVRARGGHPDDSRHAAVTYVTAASRSLLPGKARRRHLMRWVLLILGVLLFLVGGVWLLQGLDVFTQGQMAGHSQWTVIGAIVAAVGIVLVVIGATRKKKVKTA
jgi:hypothetical protein